MHKTLTTTALATLLALGATAATAEIRIGASVSATGPAAFLGDPEAKTLEMLVEQINEAGGVNGEEIALTLYDDGGDPNRTRAAASPWLACTARPVQMRSKGSASGPQRESHVVPCPHRRCRADDGYLVAACK